MRDSAEYVWFRLWRTKGIGPKSIAFAYNFFRSRSISAKEIKEIARSGLSKLVKSFPELEKPIFSKLNQKEKDTIYKEYEKVKNAGLTIIHPESQYYPENFIKYVERIGVSPIFFCKGDLSILKKTGIAVVGSRNVSNEGVLITKNIASKLARSGQNIVSGYAKGTDTAAHIGALEAGGTTTLVLSYGIDEFKIKKEFRDFNFKSDILIVTQFMPGEKWTARSAMTRNMLVCALSEAVIIIESGPERDEKGKMSGTFNSAMTALKMRNKLFVLSPSALKQKPIGNGDIIKMGGIEIFPENVPSVILEKIPKNKEIEDGKEKEFFQMELNFGEVETVGNHWLRRPQPEL